MKTNLSTRDNSHTTKRTRRDSRACPVPATTTRTFAAIIVTYILLLFAPLTAQAADNFAQTYTWNSSTPPTLPTPATGAYGNGHFLINLSGTPSGTFYAAAYSVTFRGTVTNSNASLTISGSSGTAINWEADWSGTSNAQFGAVVVTTTAFDDPPSFVVTGSIVNAGTAPALYAANVPVI